MINKSKTSLKNKVVAVNALIVVSFAIMLLIVLNFLALNTLTSLKKESYLAILEGQIHELESALKRPQVEVTELAKQDLIKQYFVNNKKDTDSKILDIFRHFMIGTGYSNVYLMNNLGDVVLSVDESFLNNNFAYRDYFQYGKSGKTHVQIAFGVVTHKPGYYFSAPIKDGEVIVGVVVIKVETSYIDHILSSSSLESTGNYFLTDENGVVVSTNKKIEEYQSLGKIEESKLAKLRSERRFEGFGMKPMQYQVAQDAIDQYDGVEVIEYRDYEDGDEGEYENELIQVKKIGEFPFYLVSESSLDSIVATIAKIVWPISGLMLIVVSLGLTIQYFVLRKTFAPLSKLEQYTQDVIDKPSLKVPEVKTGDEIESLATSIGQMVVRLSEAKIDLEAKIEEKTSELTKNILEMSEKNMAMSRNEIAMLNILEDSKELEKQLEEEKKSVEAKVERRTKELSEEQAKLMASISALPRAFLILDKDSNILIHNGRIGSIFDKSESDWSIEMINTLLGEQIDLPAKLKQVFDNTESFDISDLMFNAKYLRIYLAPVLTKDQVLLGAVMTIKDESEAKALARSRDEFFSIASHELRTPLTAIRGNTSMIMEYHKEVLKDQDLKEMIEDTHEASIRLIGIVNDFLDMSRLEQGKMEYKLEKVEIRNLIDKVMTELEGSAKEKGIELKVDGSAKLEMQVDKGKLEQILINLVGNSIKFTSRGSVTVKLAQQDNQVVIKIVDTGEGIPLQNQSLLFHKFQQAGPSIMTRDGAKGTGLGLYISRLMAEGMGGKLQLDKSEPGKGSIFSIELPIK